ncbi:hypothetical protein KCV87_01430 [Actinosynnema pretiosum subsp. pretiosum]|uniref:Uncharacterized protein n=2 Tax=Actinosynnema TaxID=40566 RepID=C6WD40_ACTMD|nr:hypothetical protein [Actinosynnema mirum]ACU37659.1 hypothetical protein Amir_3778 [Actinosynnema mirum DSM 43827]AXX31088.1 hypothetical protein APASM_3723 [Actinosynnema pretiosum subsp. pretiosum]QUF04828.1 hypothetical protein KCV87_01430 [Actinosynnema pretiosum subsp. pretiosum]
MTTVSGEAAVFLDVLGHRQGDSRILEAITLVGPAMEVEELDFDGERSVYFIFKPAGTDLLFEDDVLVSAMVRTQPDAQDPSYGLYPRPEALVAGLPAVAARHEVSALLGAPERSGPAFDRYRANGRYLHFEFDPDDRVARISALLEAV